MKEKAKSVTIDGVVYGPKGTEAKQPAKSLKGMKYCIVRTYSAGVFAGYVESRKGQEVVVLNARRLWSWAGAASLSQLAMEGTSAPYNCKFPCEVDKVELLQAIEVLECTKKAQDSITSVPVWEQ
jgi:hypothetical protein